MVEWGYISFKEDFMGDERYHKTAYVNFAIIAINIVVFLYLETKGSTESSEFMITHGALFEPAVLYGKEYWRLLTSVFMHFGMEHLANNMLILFVLGDNLERALGKVKYTIFYLVCGIGANVVSMWVDLQQQSYTVSAGASGAIFGVIGGLLYAVVVNRGQLEDLSTRQLVILVGFSLYHGFTSSGVDNVAHVAGLVIGILLAIIFYRKPKKGQEWEYWEI